MKSVWKTPDLITKSARLRIKAKQPEESDGDGMSTNIVPITLREAPWQDCERNCHRQGHSGTPEQLHVCRPMTIYREYIQNAADAMDEARASGQSAK